MAVEFVAVDGTRRTVPRGWVILTLVLAAWGVVSILAVVVWSVVSLIL